MYSHLRGGNERGVVQKAGFGQRTLLGAQGFYGNNRHTNKRDLKPGLERHDTSTAYTT